jgi:uncharacterized protein YndB with AHSA1/START domain
VPRYAADRILLAPLDDVWDFLTEPYNLPDWWPGISGVEPDRRGLGPGARWKVIGSMEPTYFRRPQSAGTLIVLEVESRRRIAFQLTNDRLDAELTLRAAEEARTEISLVVGGPWLVGLRRAFPRQALDRLHSLLRTSEDS